MWAKKTFEFPISAEKSLSILVKTSEFLRFCASNPPPPKYSGSATAEHYVADFLLKRELKAKSMDEVRPIA